MPIYQYCCNNCKNIFEKKFPMKKIIRSPKCPKCKSKVTRKLFTINPIQYKGTGFYSTDNKK